MGFEKVVDAQPAKISLDEDLKEAEFETNKKFAKDKRKLMLDDDLDAFAIRGKEDDWTDALKEAGTGLLSVKRTDKKRKLTDLNLTEKSELFGKNPKEKRKKKFKK